MINHENKEGSPILIQDSYVGVSGSAVQSGVQVFLPSSHLG